MNDQLKLPTSFWLVAVGALLWNLLGTYAFFSDTFMSAETLASLPEAQQALYESVPMWTKIVYGIATITGLLASIGLVMKKSWSVPLYLVSLVAVIIQMAYSFFMTNAREVMGTAGTLMPLLVVFIALLLYYYSKRCDSRGWLS